MSDAPQTTAANPSEQDSLTPLMRQYTKAKQQQPDALLFFRLGDFYELFYEDAKVAAAALGITLTARDRERAVPMCGVPYHAAENYIARLLRAGHRVAICEQMEDPKLTKKIVRREIVRVLTPGTAVDLSQHAGDSSFLAALHIESPAQLAAIALLDISTGEFHATEWHGPQSQARALDALAAARVAELLLSATTPLLPHDANVQALLSQVRTTTPLEDWVFTAEYALPLLERQLRTRSLDGFGLSGHCGAAIAAGAVLHYAQTTQRRALEHIDVLRFTAQENCLQIDSVSARNLELLEPLFRGAGPEATLAHTLDCCSTPMGKRLLRANIARPLADAAKIAERYSAVAELRASLVDREELRRALNRVLDLERLLSRVALETAMPRELLALAASLRALPAVRDALQRCSSLLVRDILNRLDPLSTLEQTIAATIQPEPPATLNDGGVIAPGRHEELDRLRAVSGNGRAAIAAIEERERERTGIASLKVRFTAAFGYYIEITRANLRHVPQGYERRQTLVNAERFTTPELKDLERDVLTAHERSIEIERELFAALRSSVLAEASRVRATAAAVGEADLIANFAHLAAERAWVQPVLLTGESRVFEAVAARHPAIEALMERAGVERFTPNDLALDSAHKDILLITGPNMGGKSTYLRQAALLILLAQMGSFVPATAMRYTPVDRIYTRIGASDNVAHGRSTFMVEMIETAAILNTATARSLVLLDEMGRGTATYDGLALAWATLEHLHNTIGARTLFATHYHELTLLAEQLPRLRNLRVGVKETSNGIVFLHTLETGAANKSYGIDVARLAGVPGSVLSRAREVLRQHERVERREIAPVAEPMQLTMFTPLSQRIVDRLEETDVNALTPLQALNLLEELQRELRAGSGR